METELLVLTMVSDGENAYEIRAHDTEQHRVRKALHEAATDLVFNDSKLVWVLGESFDGAIDLCPQGLTETLSDCIVVVCCTVQILGRFRVLLDPHYFLVVRRRNSL